MTAVDPSTDPVTASSAPEQAPPLVGGYRCAGGSRTAPGVGRGRDPHRPLPGAPGAVGQHAPRVRRRRGRGHRTSAAGRHQGPRRHRLPPSGPAVRTRGAPRDQPEADRLDRHRQDPRRCERRARPLDPHAAGGHRVQASCSACPCSATRPCGSTAPTARVSFFSWPASRSPSPRLSCGAESVAGLRTRTANRLPMTTSRPRPGPRPPPSTRPRPTMRRPHRRRRPSPRSDLTAEREPVLHLADH